MIVKNEEKWHRITIKTKIGNSTGKVVLVKGGRRSYLWAGVDMNSTGNVIVVSGPKTLRKLAKAILQEIK